jgi:hypothetical protein
VIFFRESDAIALAAMSGVDSPCILASAIGFNSVSPVASSSFNMRSS